VATVTYTFAGITHPSSTHVAWQGVDSDLPPASGALISTWEILTVSYALVAASDEDTYVVWTNQIDHHQLFQCDWLITVDRATVTRIDISCKAKGTAGVTNGWNLYIRNNTTPAWELVDQCPDDLEDTLIGAVTANILDYITADGHIYVLAEQIGVPGEEGNSMLEVDMTSCQLNYTPVSGFVNAGCVG